MIINPEELRQLSWRISEYLKTNNLDKEEWFPLKFAIIVEIAHTGTIQQSVFHKEYNYHECSISRTVDKLVKQGYIKRTRVISTNHLELTDQGQDFIDYLKSFIDYLKENEK